MIPANADADVAALRRPVFETEIAGREVKFLVKRRVIRDVHLAIFPEKFSVGVDDRGGVVINAGRAFFEKRRDDDDARVSRAILPNESVVGPGISSASAKYCVIFRLAKILRAETTPADKQSPRRCLAASRMKPDRLLQIRRRIRRRIASAPARRWCSRSALLFHRIGRHDLDALDATRFTGLLFSPPLLVVTGALAEFVEHVDRL